MKRAYLFALSMYIVFAATAQQRYLTQRGLNRLMNKSFGNLVTGQATSTQIANYASFDPVDGSFSFKGVVPLGNEDSGRLSYLSLRLGGDLISESYTALFSNSKLNTNSFIQAEWNVHLIGREPISYLRSDRVELMMKRTLLERERNEKYNQIDRDLLLNSENLQVATDKRTVLRNERTTKLNQHALIQTRITDIKNTGANIDSLKKYTDSLSNSRTAISGIENSIQSISRQIDSINLVVANYAGYRTLLRKRAEADYNAKLLKIEDSVALTGISFNWFTFLASTGKKKYYSFDDGRPYAEQVSKADFGTFRLGVTWNLYMQSFFRKRVAYFNLGFARIKDNNTALLSTQEIVQVRTMKNTAGDTVRTITKKYHAYTDPIVELKKWSFFTNIYYMFGSRTTGFHFFPEVNVIDEGKTITNLGLGYVVSFINEKKDKPVINAEGYINFLDLGNKQDSDLSLLKRNEIGVRFTLPFSLLLH